MVLRLTVYLTGERRRDRPGFENFRVTISSGGGRDAPETASSSVAAPAGTPSLSESEGDGGGSSSKLAKRKRSKRKKERERRDDKLDKRKRLERRLARKEAELRQLAERDTKETTSKVIQPLVGEERRKKSVKERLGTPRKRVSTPPPIQPVVPSRKETAEERRQREDLLMR